jgi:hypothetical protein
MSPSEKESPSWQAEAHMVSSEQPSVTVTVAQLAVKVDQASQSGRGGHK